jgi:mannose-6-phosphate isomerase-like protein (cupin superfamily)
MYSVGKFDESRFAVPHGFQQHSRGYGRVSLVDHSVGSVHTGFGICQLLPEGRVACCVQASEKGIYVLQGEIEMMRDKEAFRLAADDYALIPYGVSHAFRNAGNQPARWVEVQSPQPKPPGGWQDTIFVGDADWPAEIIRPAMGDPRIQRLGHFGGPRPGLVMQGLTVYRFMDEEFGASLFYMMRGELAAGGTRGTHDHTVEESYFALSGEVDMEIEGKRYHLQAGDVAWTGVGTPHAFFNTGNVPWRWIETQAPQFPARHGSRNYAGWDKLRSSLKG